ncbi:MAG: carnitine 3-dehydrogenase, partial [Gammaproteobacteria bacterium]|nr:carnitine 3-dehydrogenase [Gammaproteobacteria bacterium]
MITTAAAIGGGVIGGGWIARFLLMGVDVNVYDPDPEAERKIAEVLSNARRSLPGLYNHVLPEEGKLAFCESLEAAVAEAQWIVESVPEQLAIKQKVYAEIQAHCPADAIIASSTSGFKPSELQAGSASPEQIIVAHPFNPVYLVPLVELVSEAATVAKASTVLSQLGMKPLHVRKEIDAHIADRLLEAVWREGLWLINDGIATTEEIDDAIRYGFGLRWAQMGLFETYRIAGGEAGMAHFIKQFGPALKWPWTKLMDVPELTDELVQTISDQSDAQSGQHSIRELERIRDDNLVRIMRGLKGADWGAGELLNSVDQALAAPSITDFSKPLVTGERVIPVNWTDYNGHMNDARYAQVFSEAITVTMDAIGADKAYIDSGLSYFTVDMQVSYIDECHAGDRVKVTTRVNEGEGKKLRLQQALHHADGRLLSTSNV